MELEMACPCGCEARRRCGCGRRRRPAPPLVRLPVIPMGQLRGLIYRARRSPGESPVSYIHFFGRRCPTLGTDPRGTRLYILGGRFRITARGIEG